VSQIFLSAACAAVMDDGVIKPALSEEVAGAAPAVFDVGAEVWIPTTCSTVSSSELNRLCVDPLACASLLLLAELLDEVLAVLFNGLHAPPPWPPFL